MLTLEISGNLSSRKSTDLVGSSFLQELQRLYTESPYREKHTSTQNEGLDAMLTLMVSCLVRELEEIPHSVRAALAKQCWVPSCNGGQNPTHGDEMKSWQDFKWQQTTSDWLLSTNLPEPICFFCTLLNCQARRAWNFLQSCGDGNNMFVCHHDAHQTL